MSTNAPYIDLVASNDGNKPRTVISAVLYPKKPGQSECSEKPDANWKSFELEGKPISVDAYPIKAGDSVVRRILSEEAFPRPLTHDLLQLIVEGLKAKVARVVIADLRENTFFASVFVERESEVLSIDARPSDSIAVALRAKAPIFVNEKLLQPPPQPEAEAAAEAGEAGEEPQRELTEEEKAEQLRRHLEKLNPEDFGKFQL